MLDQLAEIEAACRIDLPADQRQPVALVGAGAIMDVAHLPAYRELGIEVVGVWDLDPARSQDLAQRHGIGTVYDTLEELLADPRSVIVDVAVPPQAQPGIVDQALKAGKHLLCQKPLALEVAEAQALVEEAKKAERCVAVQQQLRYDEGLVAARAMIAAGWIGEVTAFSITVNISTDWSAWPWLVNSPKLDAMYHSIHYFDAIRSFFGEPEVVFSTGASTPGQSAVAETRTITTMVFPGNVRAVVHTNHENVAGDVSADFRIDGSEGSIRGDFGLLLNYPAGRPDKLEVFSRTLPTDGWLPYPVTRRWLPDAFAGPIADLHRWVSGGDPATTRAEDNLNTVRLVAAVYESMNGRCAVRLP